MAVRMDEPRRGVATVEGQSMLPTLRPGDQVVVDLETRRIRCGDLVTLRAGDGLVVHRVIECGPPILTRGDNAPRDDGPVDLEQLLGRVIEIRRDGSAVACVGARRQLVNGVLGRLSRFVLRHGRGGRAFSALLRLANRGASPRKA